MVQGDKFTYRSKDYDYEFTLLNISEDSVFIMIKENLKIFKVSKIELTGNIKKGYVKYAD